MPLDKEELSFIRQTSNKYKLGAFILTLLLLLIIIGGIIALSTRYNEWFNNIPYVSPIKAIIAAEIKALSSVGLFYTSLGGGLFFFSLPQETLFYLGLLRGNPIALSIILILAGHLLSQLINYYIGKGLSRFIIQVISKKKIYKARRFVNRHGAKGILIFSLLPLPADLLSLGLGLAKYNLYRMIFYTLIGTALKYIVIALVFTIIS